MFDLDAMFLLFFVLLDWWLRKFGQTLDVGNHLALVNLIVDLEVWQWIENFVLCLGKLAFLEFFIYWANI